MLTPNMPSLINQKQTEKTNYVTTRYTRGYYGTEGNGRSVSVGRLHRLDLGLP